MRPTCPACQSTRTLHLHDAGFQPLSLVALQADADESDDLERHPILLTICEQCGHVHNSLFGLAEHYGGAGCRMYNDGRSWQEHIDSVVEQVHGIPMLNAIVEVGAGDCSFLDAINLNVGKLAIDPCNAVQRAATLGIDWEQDYFDPQRHIPEDSAETLVVMRHLLEHMVDPRRFIESISDVARRREDLTYILIEVPCVENALRDTRIEDWTYEHPQHFTELSLTRLMHQSGVNTVSVRKAYNGEVLVYLGFFARGQTCSEKVKDTIARFKHLPDDIHMQQRFATDCVFWGGAGKSATFLHQFKVPDDAIVVDSDPVKVGMFVPGTKIPIRSPEYLENLPPRTIVATTSWRADDIRDEIKRRGICCECLLKFEHGVFVEVPLG